MLIDSSFLLFGSKLAPLKQTPIFQSSHGWLPLFKEGPDGRKSEFSQIFQRTRQESPSLWTTTPGGWGFHRSQFIIWARPNYKLVVAKLPQLSWPGGCCYIRPNVTIKNFGSKDHHQHLLSAWEPCFSMSQEYLLPRSNDSVMIKMLRGTSILWWPSLLDLKLLHTNSVPLTSIILPAPVPQGFWHKTLWSMFLEDTYLIS